MKKTLLKVLSSTIALTLVATAAFGAAPAKEIPVEEVKARPAATEVKEEAKENTVLEVLQQKVIEEKAAEAPIVQIAKAEPVKKSAPVKAAEEAAVPVAAPMAEAKEETAAPAPEAEAPEIPEEAEPVMVWDISASDSDNVAMAFYAEPIAAEATEQVDVDTQTGTVYIRGTGAMEEAVYSHFMSIEKYLTAAKASFEDYYGVEVDLVYDESITDVLELDATIDYYAHETGERLYVTEEMRQNLDPSAFAEYSPKTIIIEEGITNISDYAFVCCTGIETVILPSTVETIGECAFEHCDSITAIVIPENANIEDGAFAYCDSLATVQLANADYYINGGMASHTDDGNNDVRTLTNEDVNALVNFYAEN